MPAPIPKPTQRKIAQMHLDGHRIGEIALELNLARGTIARYVGQAEKAEELKTAPAAELTKEEVEIIRAMTRIIRTTPCLSCRQPILFHIEATKGSCGACRHPWTRPKQKA